MSEYGTERPDRDARATQTAGMSEPRIVEHLKACQRDTVEHGRQLFGQFLESLCQRLLESSNEAKTDRERVHLLDTRREFERHADELQRYFCGYLGEGFIKFKNGELDTHTGEEKYQGDMLSLVENEDLEETIAISSITHRAEAYYAESLWALNQRFSVLNLGRRVNERGNPVGPIQFCESLRKALMLLSIDTKAKIITYKIFDKEFINHLREILESTNTYLMHQGILPNLSYSPAAGAGQGSLTQSVEPPPAPFAEPPPSGLMPAPDPSLPSDQYQGSLVDAIRLLQSQVAHYGAPVAGAAPGIGAIPAAMPATDAAAAAHPGAVYSSNQLIGALQNLQTQALSVTRSTGQGDDDLVEPLRPQTIATLSSQLNSQLQQGAEDDTKVDRSDMQTIDLVGMLFEYMLSDDNLPDSVKALLSYLHTPFLKIAFIDTGFFEQTEHPARLLLNNLAEAGVKWVSNDGTCQYDMYTKIKDMVSRVLEEFKNDVRLFAELLLEFSAYTKKISRRQELMERRAMEKVQGEEKLREVKIRVNQEIRSRTDQRELPSAVLLLLLQPWSDYLAFILLRYGDQSDSWKRALGAVDDILWSIQPKQQQADKTRQVQMHDQLHDMLETGFETIGYDQAKGRKLIEALVSLQKLALQSKQAEPAPAPMRDKLETMAAEKAGQTGDFEDRPSAEEEKMVENLKMIEFGTWFEFQGGKRLKVAWYNSKTLHYMLVDQMGKKVAMKSGLELAREMLAGHAKVIAGSTKPFFERALENIFHSLNARAESMQSTEVAAEKGD